MSLNTILATAPLTTTNYVLKATGTTIGNSLIWDNGTNVGIGNQGTTYKLDVSGTGNFTGKLTVNNAASASTLLVYGGNSVDPRTDAGAGEIRIGSDTSYYGNIAYSNGGSTKLTIDNSYDNTAASMVFRMRTLGTPINALTILGSGNVGIGTSSPSTTFSGLDISSGGLSLIIGADNGASTRTNATQKVARFGSYNYTNANAPVGMMLANNDGTDNLLLLGGGSGSFVAATNIQFYTAANNNTASGTERMRITSGGSVLFQKTTGNNTDTGAGWFVNDYFCVTNNSADSGDRVVLINRQNSDGALIDFRQANVSEGSISVSGSTVSYNGGHLSRYSQTELNKKIEGLLKGTVMSNLDKMAEWINPETKEPYENEQLNCMKISDVEGDKNVAGVFVNWEYDSELLTNDMNIAMTGDMIIRIAQGVVVEKGELLMSAGDGTAKPQSDDLIRSNTIAKVTSNHITCVYEDGSYCVPCVLMAC
jgi:hypothetical protein